jgi:predicted transcriptional regulator
LTNNYSWRDVVEQVTLLRSLGYTVLQIEEETQFDYEDILWAVSKLETMGFIGEDREKHNYLAHGLREEDIE